MYIPSPAEVSGLQGNVSNILAWVGAIMGVATTIVAATGTPDPDSKAGKVYRVVEILAGVFGRTKDTGKG